MILRPDIYDHNNPIYPIVDANAIRGGMHILPYTVNRPDLGDITYNNRKEIPVRHLIEGQQAIEWDILATPQSTMYRLIDIDKHDIDDGWEEVKYGNTYALTARDIVLGRAVVLTDSEGTESVVDLLQEKLSPIAGDYKILIDGDDNDIKFTHSNVTEFGAILSEAFTGASVLGSITAEADSTGHIKSITTSARDMYVYNLKDVTITNIAEDNLLIWDGVKWINGVISDIIQPGDFDTYMVKVGDETDVPDFLDKKLEAGTDISLNVTGPPSSKVRISNTGPFTYSSTPVQIIPRIPGTNILLGGGESLIFNGSGFEMNDFKIDGTVLWTEDDTTVSAKAIDDRIGETVEANTFWVRNATVLQPKVIDDWVTIGDGASLSTLTLHSMQHASGTLPGGENANDFPLVLSSSDEFPSRPGIIQYAIRDVTGGIAYNLFKGYVGPDYDHVSPSVIIGMYGAVGATSGSTNYMYFSASTSGDYDNTALKVSKYNKVLIGLSGSKQPKNTLDVSGNMAIGDSYGSGGTGSINAAVSGLSVEGYVYLNDDLEVRGAFIDSLVNPGVLDQLLSSTVNGTKWITLDYDKYDHWFISDNKTSESILSADTLTVVGDNGITTSLADAGSTSTLTIGIAPGTYDNYNHWKAKVADLTTDITTGYQVDYIEGTGIKIRGSLASAT